MSGLMGQKSRHPKAPALSKLPFPENISSPTFPVVTVELLKVKVSVCVVPVNADNERAAGVVCELSASVPRLVVVALRKKPSPTPELVSVETERGVEVLML
jgi:hypothetical protein